MDGQMGGMEGWVDEIGGWMDRRMDRKKVEYGKEGRVCGQMNRNREVWR